MLGRLQVYRDAEAILVAEVNRIEEGRKAKRGARRAIQRARKLLRIPPWADLRAIAEFYRTARRLSRITGVPHEVDHILPLLGEGVSGLHVETNLRVVTRAANRKKSNTYDGALVGGTGFEPVTSTV